jgi:hypothetical protein
MGIEMGMREDIFLPAFPQLLFLNKVNPREPLIYGVEVWHGLDRTIA